jgi:hypothetical protein
MRQFPNRMNIRRPFSEAYTVTLNKKGDLNQMKVKKKKGECMTLTTSRARRAHDCEKGREKHQFRFLKVIT